LFWLELIFVGFNFPGEHPMWHVGGDQKVSEGIQNLYAEIARNSDRAVGILAGSIVETHLTTFLKGVTRHYGKMWANRTHSSGPLGSFAVKIDLMYMFRIISKEAHGDLVRIKDIRNKFAHDLETKDFFDTSITDKIKSLKMVNRYVVASDALAESSRTYLIGGPNTFRIGGKTALEEIKQPRLRYVWSAKVFSMAFGMEWDRKHEII
jgi:mannitol repressor